MDWSELPHWVVVATAVVTATGIVVAGAVQALKVLLTAFKVTMSSTWATALSAVLSGGIAAVTLYTQGAPWYIAVAATLVALYAPKAVYDSATTGAAVSNMLRSTNDDLKAGQ